MDGTGNSGTSSPLRHDMACRSPSSTSSLGGMTKTISAEELSQYLYLPAEQVAVSLGMCPTSLKKVCRTHGIQRWPHRRLVSLEKKMVSLEASASAPGVHHDADVKREISQLNSERLSILHSVGNKRARVATPPFQPTLSAVAITSIAGSPDLDDSAPSSPFPDSRDGSFSANRTDTPPAPSLSCSPAPSRASCPLALSTAAIPRGGSETPLSQLPTPPPSNVSTSSRTLPSPSPSLSTTPSQVPSMSPACTEPPKAWKEVKLQEHGGEDVEDVDLISALVGCAEDKSRAESGCISDYSAKVEGENAAHGRAGVTRCDVKGYEMAWAGGDEDVIIEYMASRAGGDDEDGSSGFGDDDCLVSAAHGLADGDDEVAAHVVAGSTEDGGVRGQGGELSDEDIAAALAGCAGKGLESRVAQELTTTGRAACKGLEGREDRQARAQLGAGGAGAEEDVWGSCDASYGWHAGEGDGRMAAVGGHDDAVDNFIVKRYAGVADVSDMSSSADELGSFFG